MAHEDALYKLLATAIDLAEAGDPDGDRPWFVVVDDLHHETPAAARGVLGRLARYARRSRWIAVGREDPGLEDAMGQTLLAPGHGRGRARRAGRGLGAWWRRRPLRAAAGSPWRLKQLLAGGTPGPEPGRGALLDGLDPEAAAFLRATCVIDVELPRDVLGRVAPVPEGEALEVLVRRGLVERKPAGLRVHDVARTLLQAELGPDEAPRARARAAEALSGAADPRARLEALRLAVETGDPALARRLFDALGEGLAQGGLLLGLHRLPWRGRRLPRWLTGAGVVAAPGGGREIGDGARLRDLPSPPIQRRRT